MDTLIHYETAGADSIAPHDSESFYLRIDTACSVDGGADSVRRRGCEYSADDWSGESFVGIVARLPNRRGFLAGYASTGTECAWLGRDVIDDAHSASLHADNAACTAAERERDYQYQWEAYRSAERAVEDATDDVASGRAEHSALIRVLRALPATATRERADIQERARATRASATRDLSRLETALARQAYTYNPDA